MTKTTHRRRLVAATLCTLALAGCGGGESSTEDAAATTAGPTTTVAATTPEVTATPESEPRATKPPTTDPPEAPPTTIDDSWREAAMSACERVTTALFAIADPTSPDDLARFIEDHNVVRDELVASSAGIDLPPELTEGVTDVPALVSSADQWMTLALDQLATGNVDGGNVGGGEYAEGGLGSIDHFRQTLAQFATTYAIAGVHCGVANPARTADAGLNVPIPAAAHLNSGFDSVWVSDQASNQVNRVDTDTGEIEAVIDVGSRPFRLQPADGRMVVRTADAYEFIDPATNTVTSTLLKSDVGPAANRGWAVDGALWICDGQRLHRYDPTTLEAITTIELGFDCGFVHATDDVVSAWTYNEDPGQSGANVAAFIDPASNSVPATIDLPVDVGVPTIVDDMVFFPGTEGLTSVVVDPMTGTIVSTPDLGRPYVHSNDVAYDGTYLYVMVEGRDIAVVDPTTYEIVDTIEPMDFDPPLGVQINAMTLTPGALWVVNDESSILQRFDRPT